MTAMLPVPVLFVLICGAALAAQPAPDKTALDTVYQSARQFLDGALASYGSRASYQLGKLDNRLSLPRCERLDAQLAPGNRLLGNSNVRVRCLKGASWSLTVPVAIAIQADFWVAARALPAGYELAEYDLEKRSGDLAQLPAGVLQDHTQAIGRTLIGGTPAGAPLRSDQLRAPYAVKVNSMVRVIARGNGFEVASEGRAIGNASAGQQVGVKMISGAVVQGLAREDGAVEINY